MSEVELYIDDQVYAGWTAIDVTRALESAAGEFTLGVTDRWPGSGERRRLVEHAPCALAIDGTSVLRGVIDRIAPEYDATNHKIEIQGRSLPGQLVDCACEIPGGQLSGLTIADVARRVAEPFGVVVLDLLGDAETFPRVQVEQGETAFDVLERLARQRGVFLTDDAEGRLVVRRRSTELQGAIAAGIDVLKATARMDAQDQYSNYTVKGQFEGGRGGSVEQAAGAVGRAVDASVPIHRPHIVLAERQGTDAELTKRAEFEAAMRRGRARRWTYTLARWRRADGGLWETGKEVEVTDEFMGFDRARLLVVETAFKLDGGGTTVELELAPPEGFDLEVEKPRVASAPGPIGWADL